jgi:hypothetical protein
MAQESISDNEFKALFEEISRLRTVFQASGSFRHYATQLLEMMIILRPKLLSMHSEKRIFLVKEFITVQIESGDGG